MENIRYIKLLNITNEKNVIKQEGHKFFGFVDGKWKRRGLSVGYFLPGSPEYERYEEITEEEAMKILGINN